MANGKRDRKKLTQKLTSLIITLVLLLIASVLGIDISGEIPSESTSPSIPQEIIHVEGELDVHMIDVGQADSFLLIQGETVVLIDCGERGKTVVDHLKEYGIKEVDYLVGTHPHNDHMGGMYAVLTAEGIKVKTVILPHGKPENTTIWFPKLMTELKSGKYQIHYAKENDIFTIGEAVMQVIISEAEDIAGEVNNYSICLKVSLGEKDIIFTGDAEEYIEKKILESGAAIDAEILKVGHHGSESSTCDEFLDAISPDYVLISCGVGNRYEHPSKSTMEKFEERGIPVYRTDECGTVIMTITSNDVTFSCEPGDYLSGVEVEEREGK